MGVFRALPAQPKMHFVFGQDTSGPLEFSLVLHLGTTPWVMAHDFVPGLWGLLLDTRPTSFDLGHYLCSKGILNASLEALLGLSLAFLAGYYSSPLLITATGHQEGHLLLRGCLNPRTLGHLLAAQGVPRLAHFGDLTRSLRSNSRCCSRSSGTGQGCPTKDYQGS